MSNIVNKKRNETSTTMSSSSVTTSQNSSNSSSNTRSMMQLGNVLMGLLFIYSGYVQLNDPDWYAWLALYLYFSSICWYLIYKISISYSKEKEEKKEEEEEQVVVLNNKDSIIGSGIQNFLGLNVLLTAIAIGINNYFQGLGSKLNLDPDDEVGRETLGLLMVTTWFGLITIYYKFFDDNDKNTCSSYLFSILILLVAISLSSAPVLVPLYILNKDKLVEHCSGMAPFQ